MRTFCFPALQNVDVLNFAEVALVQASRIDTGWKLAIQYVQRHYINKTWNSERERERERERETREYVRQSYLPESDATPVARCRTKRSENRSFEKWSGALLRCELPQRPIQAELHEENVP